MRLINSLSFRLTILCAIAFAVSLALLLSIYYLVSVYSPVEAVKRDIRAEVERLVAQGASGGGGDLVRLLNARATEDSERRAYHLLLSPTGQVRATNLPSWPAYSGDRWISIEADAYSEGEDIDRMALVFDRRLADGARLMVGRDIENEIEREETLEDAALWLILGGVFFGLVCGVFMSRAIGSRLDSISTTARGVMAGQLSDRIPTRGSRDDFDRLAETLNLMLDRIELLLRSIRRISDSVAHELRTPLTRLHADLTELQFAAPAERDKLAAGAVDEAEKVITLFDHVLRIGRIENVGDIELGEVDLSKLLVDVVETFGPAAEERNIDLAATIPADLRVEGERNLLFQAVGNLLDNAIKYTPPDGQVALAVEETAAEIAIKVRDSGPGIAADQHEAVLERFTRLPDTAATPGLGLGLSFVKAVADLHGSAIAMENGATGLIVSWRLRRSSPAAAATGEQAS